MTRFGESFHMREKVGPTAEMLVRALVVDTV